MADLATLLESEAQAEIETILAEARVKADGIVKNAQDQANGILEGRKRVLEAELAAGIARAQSAADLESAALRLNASQSVSNQAFGNAEQDLRNFTKSTEYQATVQKLIGEAKTALGGVSKLETHPSEADVVRRAAQALGLNVPVETSNLVETGVRAFGESGQTAVTNTLLGRLARAKDGLLSEVAKLLG